MSIPHASAFGNEQGEIKGSVSGTLALVLRKGHWVTEVHAHVLQGICPFSELCVLTCGHLPLPAAVQVGMCVCCGGSV